MSGLKLRALLDDKPVKVATEFPADVHRDLLVYAEVMSAEMGRPVEPTRLLPVMVARFMATDRGFRPTRRARCQADAGAAG